MEFNININQLGKTDDIFGFYKYLSEQIETKNHVLLESVAEKSQEMLFISAISWCFAFALFANLLEMSVAIGAFLAGLSLASFPYNVEIIGKVKSLRDFFAIIFFVSLGMQLNFVNFSSMIIPAAISFWMISPVKYASNDSP